MNTSFYNGISGIKTNQFGIDVWSDNISNVNTIGYKNSNPEFSTIFSTTLDDAYSKPTMSDIGLGSRPGGTALDMQQGAFQNTDNVFDLAIGGDGWFGVQGTNNKTYYTRAGNFGIDSDGNLVDDNGNYLLGTSGENIVPTTLSDETLKNFGLYYGNNGTTTTGTAYAITDIDDITLSSIDSQTKINLPDILYYPAVPTTNVSFSANLNPQILTDDNGEEIPNIEHFSSTIISPDGNKDILDMTYTKRVPQPDTGSVWDGDIKILSYYEDYTVEQYDPNKTYDPNIYNVDTDKGIVTKIYDPNSYEIDTNTNKVYKIIDEQNAVLEFASSGELLNANMPTLNNGGTPLNIDVGSPNSFEGFVSSTNLDKSTVESHNGYVAGYLKDYAMDSRGNVIAEFDNGRTVPVAKVAVYHFQNDQGLEKTTSTLFSESANSGKPIFYTNENGETILGSQVYSNKLESSNVDLTTALTELIVMQKAFDASSKSITTSDEMIQNAINMKR